MKSKFRRIVLSLRGDPKISTEESFNFLDSAVDEVILYHALAYALEQELANSNNFFILAVENNRSQLLYRTMDSYPIRYETNSTYSSAHLLVATEPICSGRDLLCDHATSKQ